MEYEKHIKRLVLGYLKTECKSSYKRFLKTRFQNQDKHIATRVAGQTLEDILRVYSHIQDIIQGHLEDTDYYKENSAEFSSPVYLAEQLLYLLDKNGRSFTPVSTICGRSPDASSFVETHENEDDHVSDVETTPEHSLPGNSYHSDDNSHSRTPFRKKSLIFKTPFLEKIPTLEQENISSVMTMKLLQKKNFPRKLTRNINISLTTPELSDLSRKHEQDLDKRGFGIEVEETIIKNALTRTEADPIFEDVLEDFIDPVANNLDKVITNESTIATKSTRNDSASLSKNSPNMEEQNSGAVSSILAVSKLTTQFKSNEQNSSTNNDILNGNGSNPIQVVASEQLNGNVVVSEQLDTNANSSDLITEKTTSETTNVIPSEHEGRNISSEKVDFVQQDFSSGLVTQQIIHPTPEVFTLPTSTVGAYQQQQFYIVNQPFVIPQPSQVVQLFQPIQPVNKPLTVDSNVKIFPKVSPNLTEKDIMSMPTIILNERNEITYADSGNLTANTPFKSSEVHNIKEYFNVFGSSDQSPIIKKQTKKQSKTIKPTPTIKVEIFQRNSQLETSDNVEAELSKDPPKAIKGLPDLSDSVDNENLLQNNSKENSSKSSTSDNNITSNDKNKPISVSSVCTPSPLVAPVRKPTPKSSSHVRNLTFPSPIRKTSTEKPEMSRNSPSTISKQQISKDLFKSTAEEAIHITTQNENSPNGKCQSDIEIKKNDSRKSESPKKTSCPRKASIPKKASSLKKQSSPKKGRKPMEIPQEDTKEENKNTVEHKRPESWDAALRKNIPLVNDENHSTPVRRNSTRKRTKRSTELNVSDSDGKKLEEALKTPAKSGKIKGKTSNKKKSNLEKPKSDNKLAQIEEETEVQSKKILSPSKLYNTTSKRNMEVDGITTNKSKEVSHQLVSNARKNITNLLETPLKEDGIQSSVDLNLDPTNTPFTPMLKANLKDFTVGDTFSIDTPNFPVTPGLSLIENPSTAYYILNDTETNKATEAIVLSEERKSSVRKTDDEDVEMSPKVYGCKEILEDFNKSRVGQKNLALLDNRGVTWDGSSDKEDKSDNSENHSEEESNNTVTQNKIVTQIKNKVPEKSRILKSRVEGKYEILNDDVSVELNSVGQTPEDQETKHRQFENLNAKKLKVSGSSSDSEIISKNDFKNPPEDSCKIVNKRPNTRRNNKNRNVGEDEKINITKANKSKKCSSSEIRKTKGKIDKEDNVYENHKLKGNNISGENSDKKRSILATSKNGDDMPREIQESTESENNVKKIIHSEISSITEETIKQAVLTASLENYSSHITPFSVKVEMDEKRRRVIEQEKATLFQTVKTSSRRKTIKSQSNLKSPRNKRKQTIPTRVFEGVDSHEEQREINNSCEKVDSQDEFFKKSGSNLHRTNKQSVAGNISEEILDSSKKESNQDINKNENKCESVLKCDGIFENNEKVGKEAPLTSPKADLSADSKSIDETDKALDALSDNANDSFWDECAIALQPEERVIIYDEKHTSKKCLDDYNLNLEKKIFQAALPLSDGSIERVTMEVTPFRILWEIGSSTASDSESASTSSSVKKIKQATPGCSSDPENTYRKVEEPRCAKKRKQRSDSCTSTSSLKRKKTSLLPNFLNENNIEKLLTKLHGPSDKT